MNTNGHQGSIPGGHHFVDETVPDLYQQHARLRLGSGALSGKSICWFANQAVTIFEYF